MGTLPGIYHRPGSFRHVKDEGTKQKQWISVGCNLSSVIPIGMFGLSVTHATDYTTHTIKQNEITQLLTTPIYCLKFILNA